MSHMLVKSMRRDNCRIFVARFVARQTMRQLLGGITLRQPFQSTYANYVVPLSHFSTFPVQPPFCRNVALSHIHIATRHATTQNPTPKTDEHRSKTRDRG